jgi:putative acetyltransferase
MTAAHDSGVAMTSAHQVTKGSLEVRTAATEADVRSYAKISLQYGAWLSKEFNVDLSFQSFQQEIDSLPGDFAPPGGVILIASLVTTGGDRQDIGAVALRPLTPRHIYGPVTVNTDWSVKTCEMKRLYVFPDWQSCGAGRKLAHTVIEAARQMGYQRMVLDTLDRLHGANKLYEKLGFQQCSSYNGNSVTDVCFWEMRL